MFEYYLAGILAVVLNSFGQVVLKKGANSTVGKPIMNNYLNIWTLSGYFLFIIVTILNLYAFRQLPLNSLVILTPLSFILIGILSKLFLQEKLTLKQIISSVFIIIGIIIYNLDF
jgi:drug/metabolite transporter (DMT)-like permease